jgi:hypothetical protein
MNLGPDPARRLHEAAHMLAQFLREHPDLPAVDWTVSQHGLHAHFYMCDADPSSQRDAFTAWTPALALTPGRDREPGQRQRLLPGGADLHSYRIIDDVLVILTATIHPF